MTPPTQLPLRLLPPPHVSVFCCSGGEGGEGGKAMTTCQSKRSERCQLCPTLSAPHNNIPLVMTGGSGDFEEEVNNGCGSLMDEAAASRAKRTGGAKVADEHHLG